MTHKIHITAGTVSQIAILNDSATADAVWEALPFEGQANRWGDEIYFSIPLRLTESKDARQEMTVGELGYWPSGTAFCIFFGPTPVSESEAPRAYTNVNPFGQVEGDATAFQSVMDGERVMVTRVKT